MEKPAGKLFKEKNCIELVLPVNDDWIGGSFIPVSTALFITAATGKKQFQNENQNLLGFVYYLFVIYLFNYKSSCTISASNRMNMKRGECSVLDVGGKSGKD